MAATLPPRYARHRSSWSGRSTWCWSIRSGWVPALLKGFLEQVFRPGFAINPDKPWGGLLKGRSVRIVVTMGMPALFYRWFYRAHSLKSLERNILAFAGLGPIRATLIGMVEGSAGHREKWLGKLAALGRAAK